MFLFEAVPVVVKRGCLKAARFHYLFKSMVTEGVKRPISVATDIPNLLAYTTF